jgi:protein SCO1/2
VKSSKTKSGHVRRQASLLALAFALAIPTRAQMMSGPVLPPANVRPPGLKHVGIEQHLNDQIPLALEFRDETGKTVKLGDYFGKRPVILSLVYYTCPMLCGETLKGMARSFKILPFDIGNEFDVVTVSFNPNETPADATEKKADYVKRYGRPGAEKGWHFLTGSPASIAALTSAVGFQYEYDQQSQQYAHTTAIMVLTPQGKLAQYYYGIDFPARDLRLGLIQASQNKIGSFADQVLLYCYHYNPDAGKYSAVISRVLQMAGAATVLILGTFIAVMFRIGSGTKREGA